MNIEELKPIKQLRVMDLVSSAGVDVADWANFKGGIGKAASNPRYCYEWCYADHEKQVIVFNLWYEGIEAVNGKIAQRLNLKKVAADAAGLTQSRRAKKMDLLVQEAFRSSLPVRVIICDRTAGNSGSVASRAQRRMLDSEPWRVESYNWDTGDCLLVRGNVRAPYVDQFDLEGGPEGSGLKKTVIATVYERSPLVRSHVLKRAKGYCEWCGERGFITSGGSIYLETHHIQSLAENGSDAVSNVIALCANHHREAHYGESAGQFRKLLLERVENLNKPIQPFL